MPLRREPRFDGARAFDALRSKTWRELRAETGLLLRRCGHLASMRAGFWPGLPREIDGSVRAGVAV